MNFTLGIGTEVYTKGLNKCRSTFVNFCREKECINGCIYNAIIYEIAFNYICAIIAILPRMPRNKKGFLFLEMHLDTDLRKAFK